MQVLISRVFIEGQSHRRAAASMFPTSASQILAPWSKSRCSSAFATLLAQIFKLVLHGPKSQACKNTLSGRIFQVHPPGVDKRPVTNISLSLEHAEFEQFVLMKQPSSACTSLTDTPVLCFDPDNFWLNQGWPHLA